MTVETVLVVWASHKGCENMPIWVFPLTGVPGPGWRIRLSALGMASGGFGVGFPSGVGLSFLLSLLFW